MIHLRSVTIEHDAFTPKQFPFTVPVIQTLKRLEFPTEITFFVGENGSGKSTLLEAIATATQLPTIGSQETSNDTTLASIRSLSNRLQWTWSKRTRKGFFMRSEDFFGYARRIASDMAWMREKLDSVEQGHEGQSEFARNLAKMPYANEYHAMKDLYGDGLDTQSHGESYLKLFRSRFRPDSLYIMDEPEAPLSPTRQLAFLALLKEMLEHNAQFIIATHSPILLAYPGATIYNFDDGKIKSTAYDELEHVMVMRGFLNNPETYLRHLLD